MMTQRVFYPCFFLFVYFFQDVNAKPLQYGQTSHLLDKETLFPLSITNSLKKDLHGKQDLTTFGVSHIPEVNQETILNVFQRPLSSRANNELSLDSEEKQKSKKRRVRRYSLHGSKIRSLDVKWTISLFSKKLSRSQQIDVLESAFKVWAAHCRLTFMYTSDKNKADIIIDFVTGYHSDSEPFDGPGKFLAHAFYPQYGSAIHFDDDENWVADPNGRNGNSLLSAAIHEIGHSLGLRHSSVITAVMAPIVHNGRNTLTTDDINAIQAKYGKCTVQNVDAVMTGMKDGTKDHAYVFKNDWVWKVELSTQTILSGYPKKISTEFNKVLGNKSPFGTVFYETDYHAFVFMHANGYITLDDILYPTRYPEDVKVYNASNSYYTFLNGPPDAAFVDPHNPNIYHFFLGSKYYKYNMYDYQLSGTSPQPISTSWPGLPNNLDTAFYNYNENAYYFIKANEYFKLDSTSGTYYPAGVLSDIFPNICPI